MSLIEEFGYSLIESPCPQCDRPTLVFLNNRCVDCARGIIALPDGSPAKVIWYGTPTSSKPSCFDRPAFAQGQWLQVSAPIGSKPRFRWYPRWFVDRCATHDGTGIGPNNENYPAAHGWDCGGCKWN